MVAAGVSRPAIDVFADYYAQLEAGASGFILEDSIEPLTDPDLLAGSRSTGRRRGRRWRRR